MYKGSNEECLHINSYPNIMSFNDNDNKYVWCEHLSSKSRKVTKAGKSYKS